MPVVVPASFDLGILAHVVPGGFEGGHGPGGIAWSWLPKGEQIPLGSRFPEFLPIPLGILRHAPGQGSVERDGPPFPSFGLAVANGQISLREIHLRPGQILQLGVSDPGVEGEHNGGKDVGRTVAKVASLIAIVIGGYGFAHGEPGAKKALAGFAAGTGIAVLAVNVLSWLWGV